MKYETDPKHIYGHEGQDLRVQRTADTLYFYGTVDTCIHHGATHMDLVEFLELIGVDGEALRELADELETRKYGFKKGDKVEVVDHPVPDSVGYRGTVTGFYREWVYVDENNSYKPKHLEKI